MKLVAVLLVLTMTCAWSANTRYSNNQGQVTILEHENNIGDGNYNFAFKTSDGSHREEKAELKNHGSKDETMVVQGSYTFVATDGNTYTVNYIADENGYRASGDHIPKIDKEP
ncbi:hypothetical protein WA026_003507 [Henosepilachna vigintioctopunctata]|uniref:Uncharacterized protein n=1 Tax=Henosepilachna vigintioctopunctata TaxID=420089 RepID=A0AAW1TMB6_9CUCU